MKVEEDGMVAPSKGAAIEESVVERVCRILCELVLVAMVVLTSVEVLIRPFRLSLEMADEVGGYLLVALTFLSLPVALIGRAFHQVEFIHDHMGARARTLSEVVFTMLSLLFVVLLDWQLIRLVSRSYESAVISPTLLGAPLWIPQSTMFLGTTCLIYSLLRVLLRDFRVFKRAFASENISGDEV